MQISITGRHVELTEPLKAYVHDKLQHLKHSFDHVVDVHVVLDVEKNRQKCEVNIQANGMNIHGSQETEDMYASIDGAVDKLNRQLKRYRAKMQKHATDHAQRKGREVKVSQRVLAYSGEHEELPHDHEPEVLHEQEIQAKPMSVDEAMMQFELSGRGEMVFTNQETERLNVLYRRADGSVSCIEAEAA